MDDDNNGFGSFLAVILVIGAMGYAFYKVKQLTTEEHYQPKEGEVTWGDAILSSGNYSNLLTMADKTGIDISGKG